MKRLRGLSTHDL